MANYSQYWFDTETGLLMTGNYRFAVQNNIITNKYKIVFTGTRNWNQNVRMVRYYANKPQDKNICLTVRSL